MAQFPKNPQRLTPYPNFRFKLKINDKHVAGLSEAKGLTEAPQTVKFREGDDPAVTHISPGQTQYQAITLERGVTFDIGFAQWLNKVFDYSNTNSKDPASLKDFRKNIVLEVYNEAGQIVLSYEIYNAWASESTTMPELDGSDNATLIQRLVLQNEGWTKIT